MTQLDTTRLRGWRFVLFNVVLGIGHVTVLFNAGIYTSLEMDVAGAFGVDPSFITWTQTDFMLGLALGLPTANWLALRFGHLRVIVMAYCAFAILCLICALSPNFYVYLAARFLLGFAGGLTVPTSQVLVLTEYPEDQRVIGVSIWSLFALAPAALGAPLGGLIADYPGWRWLFLGSAPLALMVAAVTSALLYGRDHGYTHQSFDIMGFILIVIVLGAAQTILNQGTALGWFNSSFLLSLIIIGAIALVYLIIWETHTPHPCVDLRLFARRNFTVGVICLTVGFLCFQGILTFFVVKLQQILGYTAVDAGLVYLAMIFCLKPMAAFFHAIAKYFDARILATVSLAAFAISYFWIASFDHAAAYNRLFWPHVLEGLAFGGFFVPLTVILLSGLPPARQIRAAELANMLRIAAGGLGIAIQSSIFELRWPVHDAELRFAAHQYEPSGEVLVNRFIDLGYAPDAALAKFSSLIRINAAILSINDVFYIAGSVCIALICCVWLADPAYLPARPTRREAVREAALEEMVEEP